jgi:hypothetical protein
MLSFRRTLPDGLGGIGNATFLKNLGFALTSQTVVLVGVTLLAGGVLLLATSLLPAVPPLSLN